jgi:hypothetical protein
MQPATNRGFLRCSGCWKKFDFIANPANGQCFTDGCLLYCQGCKRTSVDYYKLVDCDVKDDVDEEKTREKTTLRAALIAAIGGEMQPLRCLNRLTKDAERYYPAGAADHRCMGYTDIVKCFVDFSVVEPLCQACKKGDEDLVRKDKTVFYFRLKASQ